jgi:hypothetical protein
MQDISLAVGSPKTGVFTLVDNKTQLPIVAPVFSNQAVGANSNAAAATFALDANNNAVATPLAAGTGTIQFSTDATWVDPGDQSQQAQKGMTVIKNFTVIPSADGATFDVVFP